MQTITLGLDVSKSKFDAALLINNRFKTKCFSNNTEGYQSLINWVSKYTTSVIHVCLEATSCYTHPLATYLFQAGIKVSVVNPLRVKGFAQTQLARNKTDQTDAKLIAQFCQAINPQSWQPEPEHIQTLQALVRRLDALMDLRYQEQNRSACCHPAVQASIQVIIVSIEQQIEEIKIAIAQIIQQCEDLKQKQTLLHSIKGIGPATSMKILAFIPDILRFKSAKQLAAFVGLNPKQHQSGSSVYRKARLSKTGDAKLRQAFYFPAIVAIRHNPLIKAFSARLIKAGKPKMVTVGAAMRKLIHIVYGVLKSQKPFNPLYSV